MIAVIKQIIRDSVQGSLLKSFALVARVLFFVMVIPVLPGGELANYVYINSLAVLLASIFIFGLNDELSRVIRGIPTSAWRFFPPFYVLLLLTGVALALVLLLPGIVTAVAFFALAQLSARYLNGLLRSIEAGYMERIQNLPWLIFIAIALSLEITAAVKLATAMGLAMLLTSLYCFADFWIRHHNPGIAAARPTELINIAATTGVRRLIPNLFQLGFERGLVLWPVWLGLGNNLDEVAFMIAVGSVIHQFGMIPAHRAYSRWSRSLPDSRQDWERMTIGATFVTAFLFACCVTLVIVTTVAGAIPPQVSSYQVTLQAVGFYSLLPTYYFYRYFLWSRNTGDKWIILISLLLFFGSALVVVAMPMQYWFIAVTVIVLAATILLGWLSLLSLRSGAER